MLSVAKINFFPGEPHFRPQHFLFRAFVHGPFVLNSEQKGVEDEGNNDGQQNHRDEVEGDKIDPTKIIRNISVTFHDHAPIVNDS